MYWKEINGGKIFDQLDLNPAYIGLWSNRD